MGFISEGFFQIIKLRSSEITVFLTIEAVLLLTKGAKKTGGPERPPVGVELAGPDPPQLARPV
jgi:hypothetical protein